MIQQLNEIPQHENGLFILIHRASITHSRDTRNYLRYVNHLLTLRKHTRDWTVEMCPSIYNRYFVLDTRTFESIWILDTFSI